MASTFDTTTGPRAGRREWIGLALLTLPLFVLAIDASVLFLAAPHIGADLDPSPTQWLWGLDIYGFMIAGLLVTMGGIGDRIGRRRLLLVGSVAFTAASVWAALSTTPEMFIAARAALGVAGATLMPSTLALIRTMFRNDQQRTFAIAIWMTTFSVGVAIGPLIGGALLQAFWWGAVFLLAVPVMLLTATTGRLLLPESRDPNPARIDPLSVILSILALITLIYTIKEAVTIGPELYLLGVLTVGLLASAWFIHRQHKITNPLVDPILFRSRVFRTSLLVLTVGIFTVTAVNFLVPQFLQSVADLAPLHAGLLTAPIALSGIAGSLAAPALASRTSPATVIACGAGISIAGYLVLAQMTPDRPLWVLVLGGALAVLGLSPATVLTTDLVIASAPEERAGSAAALSETSGELGVALGIAIMGTILATLYRFHFSPNIPDGLDSPTRDAAMDGLPGAQRTADELPADIGDAMLTAAREAFSTAFSTIAIVCAAITLALAAATALWLRQPPSTSTTSDHGSTS